MHMAKLWHCSNHLPTVGPEAQPARDIEVRFRRFRTRSCAQELTSVPPTFAALLCMDGTHSQAILLVIVGDEDTEANLGGALVWLRHDALLHRRLVDLALAPNQPLGIGDCVPGVCSRLHVYPHVPERNTARTLRLA